MLFAQGIDCLADGCFFRGRAMAFTKVRQCLQRLRQPFPGTVGIQAVATHIHGDGVLPGRQGGLAAVRIQRLQGGDEDILGGFYGLGTVFQYGVCQAVNRDGYSLTNRLITSGAPCWQRASSCQVFTRLILPE